MSTPSSSTRAATIAPPTITCDDLLPDTIIDLCPLNEYLPPYITALVEQYISVGYEVVEVNDNPPQPRHVENRVICVAMLPGDISNIQVKHVQLYARGQEQVLDGHRGSSQTWYESGVVGSPSGQPEISDRELPRPDSTGTFGSDTANLSPARNERYRWATNKVAENWQNYTCKFGAEHSMCQILTRQPGRRGVAVYKVCEDDRRLNHCQSCVIRIAYTRSYVRPTAEQIEAVREQRYLQQQTLLPDEPGYDHDQDDVGYCCWDDCATCKQPIY